MWQHKGRSLQLFNDFAKVSVIPRHYCTQRRVQCRLHGVGLSDCCLPSQNPPQTFKHLLAKSSRHQILQKCSDLTTAQRYINWLHENVGKKTPNGRSFSIDEVTEVQNLSVIGDEQKELKTVCLGKYKPSGKNIPDGRQNSESCNFSRRWAG